MRIVKDSLEALQIFQTNQIHPNAKFNHSPHQICLNRLFDHHCKSPGGKELMKSWMQRPLTNVEELEERWNMVDFLLRTNDGILIGELQKIITGAKNLKLHSGCNLDYRQIISFSSVIQTTIMCKSLLCNTIMDLEEIKVEPLKELQGLLEKVVNIKSSKAEDRIVINKNIHVKLDELRQVFDNLEEILVSNNQSLFNVV